MSGRPLFELDGLTIRRPGADRPEIDRFSLAMAAGETVVLLGEAGCGKEAVLRLFDGTLDRGDEISGRIRFGEAELRPAARRHPVPFRLAQLPSANTAPLNPHASAASQLARIVARRLACPRGAARQELRTALGRLDGAPACEALERAAGEVDRATLSFGLLAAAMASTPDLLCCDHPFLDISPAMARRLTTALLAEQARQGFAILYAARAPQSVARIGGRTIVLRHGRIVEENEAAQLMTGQTHAYTQAIFRALPQRAVSRPVRSAARGEPLLQVQGLVLRAEAGKRARPRDQIGFELRRGASLALVGEEGSGRRALMRAVLGLERRPGRVLFDAVDLNLLSEAMALRLRRRVAFISSDDAALDPRMTLWDTVEEPLRAHLKLSRELAAGYRDTALKRVGLASHDGRRPVASLSPFDRRRLQVARAFVAAPLLVVVDEPLRGLDALGQTTMRDLLAEFRVEQQAAFLVITSDFSVAEALADEVMVFADGRLVERGPIRNVAGAPRDAATCALIEAVTFKPLSREARPV